MTSVSRIGILGGSGFIGTRLTTLLVRGGHEVVIGDIRKSQRHPHLHQSCDVRDPEQVKQTLDGCDVVYNLAAVHTDDVKPVSRYYETNVDGARHTCQAADQLGIRRLIFTSSVAVYGFPKEVADERHAPNPFNHYGKSKLEAEGVFRRWAEEDAARQLTIVRPTVVFGEGNRGNFYNLCRQVVQGRFLMIGNGRNRKSVAYVGNVAAFLAFTLELDEPNQTLNYVDQPDMDMNELVRLLRQVAGKPESVRRLPYAAGVAVGKAFDLAALVTRKRMALSSIRIKKFCSSSRFDASRARLAGFEPPYPLDDAILRTTSHEWPELPGAVTPEDSELASPAAPDSELAEPAVSGSRFGD